MDFHFTGVIAYIISFIFVATAFVIVIVGAFCLWSYFIIEVLLKWTLRYLKLYKVFIEFIFERSRRKSENK